MQIDGWTLLLQAINLAVLLGLLRWLLYKPLMAVIDKRQKQIGDELASAEATRLKAEKENEALKAQRAAIDTTREQTLSQARQSAEAERQALLANAKAAVLADQTEARQQIDKERQRAGKALLTEASAMAVDLATRLVSSSPAPLDDAAFVDALLERLKATPAEDRQHWLGGTVPAPVTLVCASAPSEALLHKAQTQLTQALGVDVALRGESQPALLRGAELHFEHGVLSQSWAAELANAESEMQRAPAT
jgi:F-type H+-transporting ATPase subunit b